MPQSRANVEGAVSRSTLWFLGDWMRLSNCKEKAQDEPTYTTPNGVASGSRSRSRTPIALDARSVWGETEHDS